MWFSKAQDLIKGDIIKSNGQAVTVEGIESEKEDIVLIRVRASTGETWLSAQVKDTLVDRLNRRAEDI